MLSTISPEQLTATNQSAQQAANKKANPRAIAMEGPEPKTIPDGYDIRQADLKMHKGGIVPGKPGQEVRVIAKAGERVIPAEQVSGRNSDYRKVYLSRKKKVKED